LIHGFGALYGLVAGESRVFSLGVSMNDLSGDAAAAVMATERSDREDRTRVLIIEDDELLRATLCAFARREGYSVVGVDNGAAGLAEVAIRRPGIVVLDLELPVMDGYAFMEHLTARLGRGAPRVVVLSGTAHRMDLAHARLGADAYISKPFDAERLRAALLRLAVPGRHKRL
jgi:CheY-like chemotaxis protein